MRVVETVREMRSARDLLEGPVSMMATLGGMHRGHEVLLTHARELGRSLVASLFLNPTQFNNPSDLERYPRDERRDLGLLEAHGVDVVFQPSVDEMYPTDAATEVDPGPIADVLEGAHRPGHFRGVATVVTKILTVVRPDIAVWGAKDAQQNVVIRRVSTDLLMEVDHRIVPTVRDDDGVALSSRNAYLSTEDRRAATVLYAALSAARARWRNGETDATTLERVVRDTVAREPRAKLEYASVTDPDTCGPRSEAARGDLVLVAAVVGEARLIDNVTLE